MMHRFLIILAGCLLSTSVLASPSDAFFPLNQAIAILADGRYSDLLTKEVEELNAVTQQLENRFTAAGINVPEDYEKTLRFDADLLRAASNSQSGTSATKLVREVLEDLHYKDVASQRKGMGISIGLLSPLIKLNITTTTKGREEKGYLVRCNPRRFADIKNAMFIFNKPSSPTSYLMPPGMYVCFAMQEGSIQGKQEVSVGLAGSDHEEATITLP